MGSLDRSETLNEIAVFCYRSAEGRWRYSWLRAETDLSSFSFEGRYVDAAGDIWGYWTDEIEPSIEALAGVESADSGTRPWKTLVVAVSKDQRVYARFDYDSTEAYERVDDILALFDERGDGEAQRLVTNADEPS